MTDKEILEKVYHRLQDVEENWDKMTMDRMFDRWHDLKDLIEQEWQKADDEEVTKWEGSHGHFSNSWYEKDKKDA